MWEHSPERTLHRLFAGLTEHALQVSLGVADPPLVDYLSDLLLRFIHLDVHHRLRDSAGQPITELVAMASEADKLPAEGRTRREYLKHTGDYALFWSGLFPEHLNRWERSGYRDHVVQFAWLGKRCYRLASEFRTEPFTQEAPLLERLGQEFELCALGLREVRREWEEWQTAHGRGQP